MIFEKILNIHRAKNGRLTEIKDTYRKGVHII
jgi:hypothetical protein